MTGDLESLGEHADPLIDGPDFSGRKFQTVIGHGVVGDDTDGAVFIGSGDIYLKLAPDGTVTLHGTKDVDAAIQAVLDGLKVAIALNPYYRRDEP